MNYGANVLGLLAVADQWISIGKHLGSLNWTWSFSLGYEISNCLMQEDATSIIFCDVLWGVDLHCSSSVKGTMECLVWVLCICCFHMTCVKLLRWYWPVLNAEGRVKCMFVQEWLRYEHTHQIPMHVCAHTGIPPVSSLWNWTQIPRLAACCHQHLWSSPQYPWNL